MNDITFTELIDTMFHWMKTNHTAWTNTDIMFMLFSVAFIAALIVLIGLIIKRF